MPAIGNSDQSKCCAQGTLRAALTLMQSEELGRQGTVTG